MRSVLVSAAVAVLFGAIAAGCAGIGGSNNKNAGKKPMSRAEFARAANNACARAHRAEKSKNPTNYATFLHYLRRAIPALEHEIIALRGLTPPRNDATLFAHALANLDAQDVAAHRLGDALEAHQIGRAKGQGRQLDRLARRLRRLDRRLGLPACVKAD
jgi:hypothetical protein